MPVVVDGSSLELEDLVAVARDGAEATLSSEARDAVAEGRGRVEELLDHDEPVYGVDTGVGALRESRIDPDEVEALQMNLLRSHACGVGEPMPADEVRAAMLLKANALAHGESGVRPVVVERLLELLRAGIVPHVPRKGSVGASGDLVPLAHVGRVVAGEGEVLGDDGPAPAGPALEAAGVEPIRPAAKEGLALINGTEPTLAILALTLHDAERTLAAATIAGAMSLEALMASRQPMREAVVGQRPHDGALRIGDAIRRLTEGSDVVASHAECDRVQDAYSIRCMPQVLGGVSDALAYVRGIVETEMASVTDNPLILADQDQSATGGNFHGQPLGYAADHLALVLADMAGMSERRVARTIDEDLSEGLPPFLTEAAGIESGMMIPQYVAASLVSEARSKAYPASVDSIPTSANQEDHNAMSTIAARKAREIVDDVERVVAIELIAASEALDFKDPLEPGRGSAVARRVVRETVPRLDGDRSMSADIAAVRERVRDGTLVEAVEAEVGPI